VPVTGLDFHVMEVLATINVQKSTFIQLPKMEIDAINCNLILKIEK
jgi:hypothetical protein